MRRRYFDICDKCGANLDPGERCECKEPDRDRRKLIIWIPPENERRKRPVRAV